MGDARRSCLWDVEALCAVMASIETASATWAPALYTVKNGVQTKVGFDFVIIPCFASEIDPTEVLGRWQSADVVCSSSAPWGSGAAAGGQRHQAVPPSMPPSAGGSNRHAQPPPLPPQQQQRQLYVAPHLRVISQEQQRVHAAGASCAASTAAGAGTSRGCGGSEQQWHPAHVPQGSRFSGTSSGAGTSGYNGGSGQQRRSVYPPREGRAGTWSGAGAGLGDKPRW